MVRADWGSSPAPRRSDALVFEFSLPGVHRAEGFHTPPVCAPAVEDFASQPDCLVAGCNATLCEYKVALRREPGTARDYSLQLRATVFGLTGPSLFVPWQHKQCSTSQYAVLSGRDSVTCMACPEGGDCRCVCGWVRIATAWCLC